MGEIKWLALKGWKYSFQLQTQRKRAYNSVEGKLLVHVPEIQGRGDVNISVVIGDVAGNVARDELGRAVAKVLVGDVGNAGVKVFDLGHEAGRSLERVCDVVVVVRLVVGSRYLHDVVVPFLFE